MERVNRRAIVPKTDYSVIGQVFRIPVAGKKLTVLVVDLKRCFALLAPKDPNNFYNEESLSYMAAELLMKKISERHSWQLSFPKGNSRMIVDKLGASLREMRIFNFFTGEEKPTAAGVKQKMIGLSSEKEDAVLAAVHYRFCGLVLVVKEN